MKFIELDYPIGNTIKQIQITFSPNGTGQIMMDNYYHGQVVFSQDKWNIYLNDKSELNNGEDIQTLIQILNEGNA